MPENEFELLEATNIIPESRIVFIYTKSGDELKKSLVLGWNIDDSGIPVPICADGIDYSSVNFALAVSAAESFEWEIPSRTKFGSGFLYMKKAIFSDFLHGKENPA